MRYLSWNVGTVKAIHFMISFTQLMWFICFQVWKELPNGRGAPNFLTGIGGFLQNIIAGYGGFRLHDNLLEFNPYLPKGTTQLNFCGIDYVGASFDFTITEDTISVILRAQTKNAPKLGLYIPTTDQLYILKLNTFVKIKRTKGVFVKVDSEADSRWWL